MSENYVCFNCGKKGDHLKKDYPDPINTEQQKLERNKFNILKGRTPWQSTKFTNNGKPIPLKWRAPEESEQNKRVSDNVPHIYNPAIKGWVRNNTSPTGLPAAGANLTTAQIKMQELKAENEHLKTDCSDNSITLEQFTNYAWGTQTTTPEILVTKPTTK